MPILWRHYCEWRNLVTPESLNAMIATWSVVWNGKTGYAQLQKSACPDQKGKIGCSAYPLSPRIRWFKRTSHAPSLYLKAKLTSQPAAVPLHLHPSSHTRRNRTGGRCLLKREPAANRKSRRSLKPMSSASRRQPIFFLISSLRTFLRILPTGFLGIAGMISSRSGIL